MAEHNDKIAETLDLTPMEPKTGEIVKAEPAEDKKLENDFQYARENLYNLIERGNDGLEELLEIAKQSEHPRAFEVVGQMIGKLTETNKELLNLHKSKKDIKTDSSGPKNVSNNLFVGSTAELQKFLKKGKDAK